MEKVKTGIPGLDELMEGGIPRGSMVLVSGPSGTMKTMLSSQFIFKGATEYGEPGIYVSLEERADGIRKSLSAFNMDFKKLEDSGTAAVVDLGDIRRKSIFKKDQAGPVFTTSLLMKVLEDLMKQKNISRLVIDSLSILGLFYDNPAVMREDLFKLIEFLRDMKITALLITEVEERYKDTMVSRFGSEEFLSDGVILLGYTREKGEFKRYISIRKMRYSNHNSDLHSLRLTPGGLEVVAMEKFY